MPSTKATQAFNELRIVMRGIRAVRNNVVHAVLIEEDIYNAFERPHFHEGADIRK